MHHNDIIRHTTICIHIYFLVAVELIDHINKICVGIIHPTTKVVGFLCPCTSIIVTGHVPYIPNMPVLATQIFI